ncbi:MAG TPA: tRNA (adenosine(37)-N6)-dimethylallyltransferase MiaA [Gemmatales bacterium]|nr:tRNA (adenosine(37)-N6)-dimethylallyltransferase MiaA [Gemmatales bacterium]
MPLPSPDAFADALLLSGPTASGKTAVALEMADRLGAEIVSVDAITVYRGLDIGSAKPTPAEQARVRHHLIDVLWPWEAGSVAAWLERAAIACADIRARGRRILVVGGTPLYLKAMLRGLFAGPTADRDLRAQLEALPLGELQVKLAAVDPRAVDRIAAADRKRLVRALEVWELTGRPISDWQQQFDQPRPRTRPGFWLDWPRSDLHDRINRRVETMFAAGLVDECRRLVELDRPLARRGGDANADPHPATGQAADHLAPPPG